MNSQRSLREILDLVFGRKYLVIGVTLAVFFAATVVSFTLPRKFASFTTVRVVDNKHLYEIYGRLLVGAKSGAERIRAIDEELLSRRSVLELIEHLNLDRDFAGLSERERLEAVDGLIGGIQANTTVHLSETTPGQFIFRISHTNTDPALAQRLVTHLSTGYQNRQYAEQKTQATDALKAVQLKVAGMDSEYRRAADDLADFVKQHSQYRFEGPDNTRARLESEREKLNEVNNEMRGLTEQLGDIEAQLEEEKPFEVVLRKIGNETTVERVKEEIRAERKVLLEMTEVRRWTDDHPKVLAQKKRIADLKEELAAEENMYRTVEERVPNPVYAELQKSRIEVSGALTTKRQMAEYHQEKVDRLLALDEAYPELEAQWSELVEKKDDLKRQIDGLREQEETAKTTWQNKVAENTLIFDVLDPPTYPLSPVSPNRLLIAVVGLLIGLGAGVGTVFVLDFFDQSFRYTEEVAAALEVPVLGSIARIETMAEREVAKRKKRVALAAVLALTVAAGAAALLQVTHDGLIRSFLSDTVSLGG